MVIDRQDMTITIRGILKISYSLAPKRAFAVEVTHVRNEICRAFHQTGEVDTYEYDYHDRYEVMEMDPDEFRRPQLAEVSKLL